jgi:hypothetical protein
MRATREFQRRTKIVVGGERIGAASGSGYSPKIRRHCSHALAGAFGLFDPARHGRRTRHGGQTLPLLQRERRQATVCAESVCSLFEETMRINNTLSGFSSFQIIEQFHETRLI